MVTEADLRRIANVSNSGPMRFSLAAAFNRFAAEYGVASQKAISQFLANVCEETGGFTKLVENLNYSAKRLHEVWPKRFPTITSAKPYANNPKALANKVYGGRMGNTSPGDGALYIGRGPGQATGKSNYALAKKLTGIDFIGRPELMANPDEGMQAALALWQHWRLSQMAEGDQTTAIRKRWNGGATGLANVKANYARAMKLDLSVAPAPAKLAAKIPPAVQAVVDDAAAEGRFSKTEILSGALGVSGVAKVAQETADAVNSSAASISSLDPWVVVAVLTVAFAGYIWYDRRRKKNAARAANDGSK